MKRIKLSSTNLFFTSDPHFFHTNIIKYTNRPFKSINEMNNTLIENWNNKVPPESVVIVIGDFAFGRCTPHNVAEIVKSLNGNIILVEGNHDQVSIQAQTQFNVFAEVYQTLDLRVVTQQENKDDYVDVNCNHYPGLTWNKAHFGAWQAFGHVHSTEPIKGQSVFQYDVGMDGNNFTPISFQEFGQIITRQRMEGILKNPLA